MSIVYGTKITTLMSSAANGDTYGDAERRIFRGIQTLIMPNIISFYGNTPPSSPTNGQTYIVGTAATGLWAGQANSIAYWALDSQDGVATTGIWEFYPPQTGWQVFDNNTGLTWRFNGTNWNFTRIASTVTLTAATSVAVAFPVTYTGTNAPIVILTAVGGTPAALGSVWVTNTGSAGAWTGFTVHVTTSGTQIFNYEISG